MESPGAARNAILSNVTFFEERTMVRSQPFEPQLQN